MIDVMNFKGHTPGPWQVLGPSCGGRCRRVFAGDVYVSVVGGSDQSMDMIIANANLLAAAPELLDELLQLRERVKELEADAAKYRALMESLGNMPTEHPPIWDSRNVSQ